MGGGADAGARADRATASRPSSRSRARRSALCLHVTAETAVLARALARRRRGRRALRGQPAVDAGRRRRRARRRRPAGGVRPARRGPRHVRRARRRARRARARHHARRRRRPRHACCTRRGPRSSRGCAAATEETTTGLVRLRGMEAEGRLACPVIAVNEARTERAFNDRYGTGQSTHRRHPARDERPARRRASSSSSATAGPGKGIALRAQGLGASVIVCEVDPIRALEARMEGFQVMTGAARPPSAATSSSPSPATRAVLRRRALRAHEGRRDPRQRGALRRRDRPRRAASASRARGARCARSSRSSSSTGAG